MTVAIDLLQNWNARLAHAFGALGTPAFPARLVEALACLAPIESVLFSLECRGQPPRLLYQSGIPERFREALTERYYARGYLLDPFCLALDEGLAEGFYPLAEVAPDDFFSSAYYTTYYLKCGSVEDNHYIIDLEAGRKLSLCVYQGIAGGRFDATQIERLRSALPLVVSLCRAFAAAGGIDALACGERAAEARPGTLNQQIQAAFASFGDDLLTEREREIAHLLLRGHSVKSSARVLAISPETVRMHRKHLYTKLQINSQAELFALFIDWLTRPRQG